ncbi:MAG: hypothetical protein ACM3QS_04495, partial [Bacteroidota bacterium]
RFQQEYGLQMTEVFRDCCLRSLRQDGTNGLVRLWMVTLIDLVQSVISEHAHKETQMKKEMKPQDVRGAGWSLILGAISMALSMFLAMQDRSRSTAVALLIMVFITMPLLAFGILGLRKQYGAKTGGFGRNILLAGAILGPLVSIIGMFLGPTGTYWLVPWSGLAVLLACLAFFGVAAFITRPMPRWSVLPLIAGLPYPALLLYAIISSTLSGYWESGISENVIWFVFIVQVAALAALGYMLKSDVVEAAAAPA